MYERFTDRARKVMQLANQEAQHLGREYIGTEHVLLGLIQEGSGVAANILKNLDVDLRKTRLEVEKLVQSGPDMVTMGKLPQTPRAKKLIEFAIEEAKSLGHNYVGTEHLLLGLLREEENVAAQVLMNLGLTLEEVREEVLNLLGHGIRTADDTKTGRSLHEKFTDRACKVMQLANQEAQRFNHEYIGTEHMLLALIKEGSGVAAGVLNNLNVDRRNIRLGVEKLIQSGPDMVTMGALPLAARARKVIEYSMEEAQNMNHDYVGTEHILLGLIRDQESVAGHVLASLGLTVETVRAEVQNVLSPGAEGRKWTQRGAGPLRPMTRIAESQCTRQGTLRYEVERVVRKGSPLKTKDVVFFLSWMFLVLGIVGLALGISEDRNLMLPGTILMGASIIALALGRW